MIEVKGLTYRYPGTEKTALRDVSFTVSRGEIFGFLGPSGVGKSTLQKVMIGILKDYAGSVKVEGQELRETGAEYLEKIGVAFETPYFYHKFTALENLRFFSSLYRNKTLSPVDLLKQVGLSDAVHQRVSSFSKGMKTRLNVCRAFLHDPELVFLDEPTSGLDPVSTEAVKKLILEKKAEGKTILLTTHHMAIAEELCDRVALIVDGKIALIDAPRVMKLKYGRKMVRVEYRDGDRLLAREFPLSGLAQNDAFLRLLSHDGLETIHTQETTLERIFIAVTGRKLA
ncbi:MULTISPECIES: ABC transporter ATP-binding protein [Thermoactinomyces]|uniref:ABC transporter ATP-binding protein n=1 Tax=Thermoactinomyces daqus TaxID=1329516 RepID=A0A7W1X7V2_9BACL|nr:ABC transporter ATP-binding protein [Thermoactinomyces daqus]MBA4541697.1 ABC transporter ATP-binding protein [Thermoactinomyces daqus]MBH8597697.1 ABC transporter ATP-binding protein [Thermoactinomyces sp. CICC 10523]MBH8606428.1 ABC transporter ATP-binding protein [Thermoactinomyces sp. CICC 10521]